MADEIQIEAKAIKLEKIENWYTPVQAREIATAALGVEGWKAGEAIRECVRGGLISVAASSSSTILGEVRAPIPRGPLLIPPVYWAHVWETKTEFWQGRAAFRLANGRSAYDPTLYLRCFRLKLDPEQVRTEFPAPGSVAPKVAPSTAGTRGRPRGAHWEDMLVEMARRIHFGDFKPAKQADLERAMLDWLSEHGHPGDESTVRLRASKLFKAMMGEG
jgi:hypothetical protein